MADKEYTYQDVAEHNTKKDLFVVIHDKIYDCTKFVDEHPGYARCWWPRCDRGFRRCRPQREARETLEQLLVGTLKRNPGDPSPKAQQSSLAPAANTSSAGLGTAVYAIIFIGGILGFGAFQYLQSQQGKEA
ncbi:putative cytochrome b5 [Daldinia childiae]|uniref:putative cytochrome b5 n=1 Tax=Daldinia childiae TaxID=326645 RepID=UPI0014451FFD|nr:putative cytochrome b5 [Daldinia childiae]KAF3062189.1 putative cytochrome b5 [Daldinia childiae]